MSNNLLQKLMAAQTDEERSWIVTENLLESLPEDVARALWAVAIPHWFDSEILAALCPELADRADEVYRQLQDLSCVEVFPERGHNVHQLTRNQLLDRLWKDNSERFRQLSNRAAAYFSQEDRSEIQIERIYHLIIANSEEGLKALFALLDEWQKNWYASQLEFLITRIQEQVRANRSEPNITSIFVKIKIWYYFFYSISRLDNYIFFVVSRIIFRIITSFISNYSEDNIFIQSMNEKLEELLGDKHEAINELIKGGASSKVIAQKNIDYSIAILRVLFVHFVNRFLSTQRFIQLWNKSSKRKRKS